MSTELFIPQPIGKKGTEFYRESETFKRRSAASKIKATKYWSDGRHHRRICKKLAKPVAAYRKDGTFVGWWPSSRKASLFLFPNEPVYIHERNIRNCRYGTKKSHKGFMFRDYTGDTSDIPPYARKPIVKRKGYKKNNSYLNKPCEIIFPDGDFIHFDSVKDCAAAIQCSPSTVSYAISRGKKAKGYTVKFIKP